MPGLVTWLPWVSAIGLGGAAAAVLYWLLHPPKPLGWDRIVRVVAPRREPIPRAWLELTQIPLTPAQVTWLNRIVGGVVAVGIFLWTLNPFVAAAFGSIAMPLPEAILRVYARRQWQTLDRLAFVFAQTLAFFLNQGTPTLEAFRRLLEQHLDPPLDGWVQDVLVSEAHDTPLEIAWKARASRIHHLELMLLGDILAAERTTGGAAHLINRLLQFWEARLDADAKRRGKLKMSMMIGYLMVFGSAAGMLGAFLITPSLAQHAHQGIGWVITSLGAGLVAVAAYIQQSTVRKAETV